MNTHRFLLARIGFIATLSFLATRPSVAAPPIWEADFGSPLNMDDETVEAVNFGTMAFPFVGVTFSGADELFISSNGFVSLGGDNGTDCCAGDPTLLVGDPFPRIAPLWVDLDPATAGDVFLNTFSDDADAAVDRIVVTWDTVLFANKATARTQVQLLENGTIVFGYDGLGPLAGLDDDTLIGLSPAGGAANPGSTDVSNTPFSTGAQPTVYQLFSGNPPPIDVNQTNLVFTPNGRMGWTVTQGFIPEPSSLALTFLAFVGTWVMGRRRTR